MVVEDEAPPPEVKPEIIQNVAMMLQFVHGAGPMKLDNDEAMMLANAATNVGRYYVKVTISAKGQAWGALLGVAAMVYMPKMLALAAKRRAGKAPPPVDLDKVANAA